MRWHRLLFMTLAVAMLFPATAKEITVTEFLRSPEPAGQPLATRVLEGREEVQQTPGAHEGHRVFYNQAPTFECGEPAYAIRYQACLDVDKHGSGGEVVAKEGMSGIGLSRPTGANWYTGGCIDVRLAGQSIGNWRPQLVYQKWETQERLSATYSTPQGRVKLTFTQLKDDDKLLVTGDVEAEHAASLEVKLRCFPGGTHGDMQRWAATATRRQEAPGKLMLRPSEPWVVCADALMDRAVNPKGQGCAAALFDPAQVMGAWLEVTGYPIYLTLNYPAGTKSFHLALWEFPKLTNEEALAHMNELDSGLSPSGLLPAGEAVRTDAPPGTLVADGQPAATIVLPAEPSDELVLAARQLQTAADIAVAPQLDDEGYVIKSLGPDLAIIGGSDLGAFYGVCGLLEDHLGVRWYVPGDPLGECVPEMKDIVLTDLDDRQTPSFPMRWIGRGHWSVMNRQNRGGDGLEPGFKIEPGIYHTQGRLLPHTEYFNEHPEYFALVRGKRSENRQCKLCYSNPQVAREVAHHMAQLLEADPDLDLLSLSPTDGQLWCECEACQAMDEQDVPRDQSKSRRSLLFYNAVAAELRKTHPGAHMLVGAYNVYNRPPKDPEVKADPMLAVIITHYEDYCMAHPVNDPNCPPNRIYNEVIRAWQGLGCDIYFYEYYWKVNWMDLPWPITHCQAVDIPYFKSVGVKGVYTQFNTQNAWTLFPAYYVPAKLLWNVNADVEQILDEMCDRMFGAAGKAMREYYQVMEDSMANCGHHFPGHGTTAGRYVFTDEVLKVMGDALSRAHQITERGGLSATVRQAPPPVESAAQARARMIPSKQLVEQRLAKIDLSYEYTRRLMKYANLRARIDSKESAEEALATAQQALNALEELVNEVRTERAKWNGIVSTSVVSESVYLGREVTTLRKRVAQLRAHTTEVLVELPKTWKFKLDPDDQGQDERWFAPDLDDTGWEDIQIGKPWEEQGHEGYDGFAWYRLKLKVEPAWLTFDAVDGEAWVYLNGELLGHHEGWDEPFSLPLKVEHERRAGQASGPVCLAVRVWDGSNQGGIYRRVAITRQAQ